MLQILNFQLQMLQNNVNFRYRQNENLKELISPSLFPRTVKEKKCSIEKANRRWILLLVFLLVRLPNANIK